MKRMIPLVGLAALLAACAESMPPGEGGIGPRHYLQDMAPSTAAPAEDVATTSTAAGISGQAAGTEAVAGAQPPPDGYPSPAVCPPPPSSPPIGSGAHIPSNVQPSLPFPAPWQAVLDQLVAKNAIPGAVIIIKSPDWGVRVGTAGYSNLAAKTPIRPDQQFRIGSVSKVFIAQTILQMEQEGKLRLTDPVLTYLANDPIVAGIPNIERLTIADLLQMTSGVANYLGAPSVGYSPQVTPERQFAPDQLMAVLSQNGGGTPLSPDFAPGATYPNPYWATVYQSAPPEPPPYPFWYYSNSNYILLGLIAEHISGMAADQLINLYVINKLGLGDTYFAVDRQRNPDMHGYTRWGSIPYPVQVYDDWCDVTATNPSYAWTAGAVVSTPWDLLRLSEAMFKSDALLNRGSKIKWFNFASADIHIGWQVMGYGMGALMQPTRWYGMARGHGGAFPGYKTLLYYFFDEDTTFILATNTWDEEWEVVMLDSLMALASSAVTTPSPANGAGNVPGGGTVLLSWQAGRFYGSAYRIYWGTDAGAVNAATPDQHPGVETTTATEPWLLVPVARGQSVYWRVDTVRPGEAIPTVPGPVWHFTGAN